MTELSADRDTPALAGPSRSIPVAAATTIYAGSIVCADSSGNAIPGSTATGLVPLGRAEEFVDNSDGSAADLSVLVKPGIFRWGNSASSDEITKAEVGDLCYIVDDQTVAKTSGSSTRSVAGVIHRIDSLGVWVRVGYEALIAPAGALLAASNLSDLAAAATARGNLGGGANKIALALHDIDLVGANAEIKRFVSPVAGDIAKIYSVINGALTTGNATLTAKIGATAVTDGVITVTQSGSAAGDVDSATPSDDNTVAVGDVVSITVGGTNDAAKLANVMFLITPSA